MALIAAHLNAGHPGGDSVAIGIYSPSSPTSIPSQDSKFHILLPSGISLPKILQSGSSVHDSEGVK